MVITALLLGSSSAKAEEKELGSRTLLRLGSVALGLESNKRLDENGKAELGPPKLSLGWQNDKGLRVGAFGETKNGIALMLGFKYQF